MPHTPNYNNAIPAPARLLIDDLHRLIRERDAALTALASARMLAANRLAAIRATLGADRDGEADPLAYLRDQLASEAAPAGEDARRSGA